jgi:hypothetical protein
MRARRGRAAEDDAETVARVRGALEAHLADGGPGAAVSITYVLDLLKPSGVGMWSFDPEYRKAMRETPAADPHRDPLTGARWAGPPGSAPPGKLGRVGF